MGNANVLESDLKPTGRRRSAATKLLRAILVSVLIAVFPVSALAALAVDAVAGAYNRININSISWSHTTSGSERALIVGVAYRNASAVTVSCTYNSVTMTNLGGTSNGQTRVRQFALANPASGTNTVSCTFSGTVNFSSAGSVSFTGAHQVTATLTGAQATGTAQSLNVTSAPGEIVVDIIAHVGSGVQTVGAGQTQIWNQGQYTNDFFGGAGSYESGATTVTMDWTGGGGPSEIAHAGVSVKSSASGGVPSAATRRRMM